MKWKFNLIFLWVSLAAFSQVGYTDPIALNYSPCATINNGSCVYTSITKTPQMFSNLGLEILDIGDQPGLYFLKTNESFYPLQKH